MQTFLPYEDFYKSARSLDYKRLGKQRVEAYQILKVLMHLRKHPNAKIGWRNHPAVKMWQGYESALFAYTVSMCTNWIKRGYKDTLLTRLARMKVVFEPVVLPPWLGNRAFHKSHRSNLVRKDKKFYGKQWNVPNDLPYIWPGSA